MGRLNAWLETILRQREACLMGVVNATPDSFYDGGRFVAPEDARAHVERLLREGADVLDIGGESTRPGSTPVPGDEQIRRIGPAIRRALELRAVVSVDTTCPSVAERMLGLGARIVNDVSCLSDTDLARVTARAGGVLVLMHSREPMSELRGFSAYPDDDYADVVGDVLAAGMAPADVWLDPGLGFAKNARQSVELLARIGELAHEGVPVVVGPSRKSFIASVDAAPPEDRLGGTIAACLAAQARGASVLRVHDVAAVRQALAVARALRPSRQEVAHAG